MSQQGIVLITVLIVLLAVTMLAVASAQMAITNLTVIGNMENKERLRSVALATIEEAIGSLQYDEIDNTFLLAACAADESGCYKPEVEIPSGISVTITSPVCVAMKTRSNADLDLHTSPSHASCYSPDRKRSLCVDSIWEIEALAIDTVSGAETRLRQGVSMLHSYRKAEALCPV